MDGNVCLNILYTFLSNICKVVHVHVVENTPFSVIIIIVNMYFIAEGMDIYMLLKIIKCSGLIKYIKSM